MHHGIPSFPLDVLHRRWTTLHLARLPAGFLPLALVDSPESRFIGE